MSPQLGDVLDRLLGCLGDLSDAAGDEPPETVARRVAARVYVDEPSRRAIRWARTFLAVLDESS